jgi:hypothetical protein
MRLKKLILTGSSRCGTTITRNLLSSHPAVWLTNELRVFHGTTHLGDCLHSARAEDYFRMLQRKVVECEGVDYHRFPAGYDFENLVEDCLRNLREDSLRGRIDAVLAALYGPSPRQYVGDKGASHDVLLRMREEGIDYKLIVIHRDGRDAAASGARRKWGREPPWSDDAAENAESWAENFEALFEVMDRLDPRDCLLLRFEDYVEHPDRNFRRMADFLGVDPAGFKRGRFNPDAAHIGCHVDWCPDWRSTFSPKAVAMLARLGYVETDA